MNFENWLKGQILTTYGVKPKAKSCFNDLTISTILKVHQEGMFIFPAINGQLTIAIENN